MSENARLRADLARAGGLQARLRELETDNARLRAERDATARQFEVWLAESGQRAKTMQAEITRLRAKIIEKADVWDRDGMPPGYAAELRALASEDGDEH